MFQCILNVPLRTCLSKVTYSQVHSSSVLKALLFQSFQWISATGFAELMQFIQNVGVPELSEEKNLVFHWRKISHFISFSFIFSR